MLTGRTMTLRSMYWPPASWFSRAAAVCALAAAGCASGSGLQVTKIAATADQPANVAVYMDVKDKLGRPIPNLQEKNFRVYEDGKLVTTSKAKRTLLEPKLIDKRFVLLLVDMSGPIADSEDLPDLANQLECMTGFWNPIQARRAELNTVTTSPTTKPCSP